MLRFGYSPGAFHEFLAAVDREFIASRGRVLSLAERFPRALAVPNEDNVVLGFRGDQLVCGAAVQTLVLRASEESTLTVAAVGAVWTHPAHRSMGHGSALLEEVIRRCRARSFDAVVLWSNRNGFYAKSGFQLLDTGWSAEVEGEGAANERFESVTPSLREKWSPRYVQRHVQDWDNVPLPAARVAIASLRGGCVVFGESGDRCYIYESLGSRGDLAPLVERLRRHYLQVFVNISPEELDFYRSCGLSPRPQSLTMWFPLAAGLSQLEKLYVPYLDRI